MGTQLQPIVNNPDSILRTFEAAAVLGNLRRVKAIWPKLQEYIDPVLGSSRLQLPSKRTELVRSMGLTLDYIALNVPEHLDPAHNAVPFIAERLLAFPRGWPYVTDTAQHLKREISSALSRGYSHLVPSLTANLTTLSLLLNSPAPQAAPSPLSPSSQPRSVQPPETTQPLRPGTGQIVDLTTGQIVPEDDVGFGAPENPPKAACG